MRARREVLCATVAGALLSFGSVARADVQTHLDVGPRAGVSVNQDQWVLGGFARLGGLWPRDLGVSAQALMGLGGNRVTVRAGLRLDWMLWLGAVDTVALYPAVGASAYVLVPTGRFAEFCEGSGLPGCSGTYFGVEVGGGIRIWKMFFEGMVGTGELPVITATLGLALPVWEASR